MVVRGGSHFCQSPKSGGGQEFFNQNIREGQHFLSEKIPKFPIPPPPPRKNVPSLNPENAHYEMGGGFFFLALMRRKVGFPACLVIFVCSC